MIDTCPHCNRKLMTLTSPVCNWCGQRIEDKRFQAEARAHRLSSPLYGEQSQVVEDLPPENRPRLLELHAAGPGHVSITTVGGDPPPYNELREQAIVVRPEGVMDDFGAFEPYGAAMEIATAEGISTLVAMADGSVSLYLSAGGGITGGGAHPKVRRAGLDFVDACRKSMHLLKLTRAHPMPENGRVRFFLMTPTVTYSREASEAEIIDGSSQLAPLFDPANRASTELRRLSEEAG